MSRLEKLLTELCPDGVPYMRLDECCILVKGKTPIQKAVPGEYPLVVTTVARKSSNDFQFEEPTVCVPLVSSRGHGVACLSAVYYQEGKFALGNILCGVTPLKDSGLTAKFLYYYLNLEKDKLIVPLMKGGANVSLTVNSLKTVRVPIPPIEVQTEVIRLIEKFSELISTLQAELTARKKQYEYYKTKVFTSYEYEEVTLGEILLSIHTGLNPRKFFKLNTDDAENYYVTIREFKGGQLQFTDKTDRINDEALQLCNNRSNLESGDVLFSGTGTIGEMFVIEEPPINWNIKEGVYALKPDTTKVLSKYLKYYLSTKEMHDRFEMLAEGGTVKSISMKKMDSMIIRLPSLINQRKIISVLDRFDVLCNDISLGLPAEIEARQKQYEYYRDKLLSFEELS